MPRETSPYIVGEYWLDKRRDGKSPFWQIASYNAASRSVRYRSTHFVGEDDARRYLDAFFAKERAKQPQQPDEAAVVPLLMLYWEEHGQHTLNPVAVAGSLRAFIGYLMLDADRFDLRVSQVRPALFEGFRKWRMAPHEADVPWKGKTYPLRSAGVKGESVSTNLDHIRAAFGHAVTAGRLPYAPKVPTVKLEHRSPPRDRVLSTKEMGAIIGFAAYDIDFLRFVLLQLATASRPDAALKMDPRVQYRPDAQLLDLHPPGAPRTKKRNPIVPVIPEFRPWLEGWAASGPAPRDSGRTRWRTMRRCLGLTMDVHPKTIRHTVATRMRSLGVPAEEISGFLGHVGMNSTTAVYAKYDPAYLGKATEALSIIWRESCDAAHDWLAAHMRSKVKNEPTKVVATNGPKA